jgi:hypothetical protein
MHPENGSRVAGPRPEEMPMRGMDAAGDGAEAVVFKLFINCP